MSMPVIQHIRGTAEMWAEVNPILYEGELGLETDTRKFKFGDGIHTWSELEYANNNADIDISDTENLVTKTYLEEYIAQQNKNYVTQDFVSNSISNATKDFVTQNDVNNSLSNIVTLDEVNVIKGGFAASLKYANAVENNEVFVYITTELKDTYTQPIEDLQLEAVSTKEEDVIVWSVSDENSIATLSEDNKLNCSGSAVVTITATSSVNDSVSDTKVITVTIEPV